LGSKQKSFSNIEPNLYVPIRSFSCKKFLFTCLLKNFL
jgi:hypothetical protein